MMKIIDNFLTPSYHRQIEKHLLSPQCPWYYHQNITNVDDKTSSLHDFGFGSNITTDGKKWINTFFLPFAYQIQDQLPMQTTIGRMRLDMTLYNPDGVVHHPHVDSEEPHFASIYYVNDSDGDTILYNETELSKEYTSQARIEPKANRLLIFNGKYYHTGSSPSHHKNRIIINSNFMCQCE